MGVQFAFETLAVKGGLTDAGTRHVNRAVAPDEGGEAKPYHQGQKGKYAQNNRDKHCDLHILLPERS